MSHTIIVKKGEHRIDPKDPEHTDPEYAKAVAVGQARLKRGDYKISDRGEQEYTDKMMKGNPNNVPGLPTFFPPLQIKSFIHQRPIERDEYEKAALERFRESMIRVIPLWCWRCQTVTDHWNAQECRCSNCGKEFKPARN
jgi:hypothetical protein